MKKILSVVLLAAIATSSNAMQSVKNFGTASVNAVKNHKVETVVTAASLTVIAAGLFDYYKNDAKVMKAALRIAKAYGIVIKDKTISAYDKVRELVENHPVIAISALTGAATLIAGGADLALRRERSVPAIGYKATKAGLETAGNFVKKETVAAGTFVTEKSKAAKDFTVNTSVKAYNKLFKKAEGQKVN